MYNIKHSNLFRIENIIFSRGWLTIIIGFIFSVAISSLFYYWVNYVGYYDSRGNNKYYDAGYFGTAIEEIVKAYDAVPGDDIVMKESISKFISPIWAKITVSKNTEDGQLWQIDNEWKLDYSREMVEREIEFSDKSSNYIVFYQYSNTPPFGITLWRAWSWSAGDWLRDKNQWAENKYVNRSKPLYYAFALMSFFTATILILWRKRYLDSQVMINTYNNLIIERDYQVNDLRLKLSENESQSARTESMLEWLENEMEKELKDSSDQVSKYDQAREEAEQLYLSQLKLNEFYKKRIEELEESASQVEKSLQSGSKKAIYDIAAFKEKLSQEENREIIQYKKIKDELFNNYIQKNNEKPGEHWLGNHGKAHELKKYITQMNNSGLIDKFFEDISGSKYVPDRKGTIVVSTPEGNNLFLGRISIYIDEPKGRCINLRFSVKKEGHVPIIGFILALMIKAESRYFAEYQIKIRGTNDTSEIAVI